jgi:alginate O-acetyltransferase complex protein AlgI
MLLFSGLWDYVVGLNLSRCAPQGLGAKVLLALSMCGNLGLLILLKYGAFLLGIVGIDAVFAPALPIGISFYTFQTMSYTIDLYRGEIEPQRDPVAFLAYVSMFPQLVAGPIVRYADVAERLRKRRTTVKSFSDGVTRFAAGLGKKVLFANHAGQVASELLGGGAEYASVTGVWLGALMFMFQIYFDFSGYSDMAIGLAKMVGFDFKENFDHPYESKSVTEFWRRWHISLGTFFRDYLYIPLGGNRKRVVFNLLIVWGLTGLWHGASVNFLLWGLYFGVLIILEKYVIQRASIRIPAFIMRVYCLLAVLFGWVIFYVTDLEQLAGYAARFWGLAGVFTDPRIGELFWANVWILPVYALFSTAIPSRVAARISVGIPVFIPVVNLIILCFGFAMLIGQSYNPFLYFRF